MENKEIEKAEVFLHAQDIYQSEVPLFRVKELLAKYTEDVEDYWKKLTIKLIEEKDAEIIRLQEALMWFEQSEKQLQSELNELQKSRKNDIEQAYIDGHYSKGNGVFAEKYYKEKFEAEGKIEINPIPDEYEKYLLLFFYRKKSLSETMGTESLSFYELNLMNKLILEHPEYYEEMKKNIKINIYSPRM